MTNFLDYMCPFCGSQDHIDVVAKIWVRLTMDGSDPDLVGADHEYDANSPAYCANCDSAAPLRMFDPENVTPHAYVAIRYDDERGAQVSIRRMTARPKTLRYDMLPPRLDLANHGPDFEWGYANSGTLQLAVALLADATGSDKTAKAMYRDFAREVVSNWKADRFVLTRESVIEWVSAKAREKANG